MDWYPLYNSLRIALFPQRSSFSRGDCGGLLCCASAARAQRCVDVVHAAASCVVTVVAYLFAVCSNRKNCRRMAPHESQADHGQCRRFSQLPLSFSRSCTTRVVRSRASSGTAGDLVRTLGRSNTWIFWRVRMPCCRQGILAGTVLAFARALGEYGATSMVAGYTPGRTATISTTVYQLWRTNDDALAFKWVVVNLAISAVVLLAVNLLEKRERGVRKAWH